VDNEESGFYFLCILSIILTQLIKAQQANIAEGQGDGGQAIAAAFKVTFLSIFRHVIKEMGP
jgi:hypothetical protein